MISPTLLDVAAITGLPPLRLCILFRPSQSLGLPGRYGESLYDYAAFLSARARNSGPLNMEEYISFLTGYALIYYENVFHKSKSHLLSGALTPFRSLPLEFFWNRFKLMDQDLSRAALTGMGLASGLLLMCSLGLK